ncbi:MAG: hypothetical protein ABWY06_07765 [Pseudomonas sp.]|uniref:WD40 repeat domain-containing protein n=1 Tax=Pseudomonas sp. TaxID=306 RepID=UPI0033952DE3
MLVSLSGCQSAQEKAYQGQRDTAPPLYEHFQETLDFYANNLSYNGVDDLFSVADGTGQMNIYSQEAVAPIASIKWIEPEVGMSSAAFLDSDTYYLGGDRLYGNGKYFFEVWRLGASSKRVGYDFESSTGGEVQVNAHFALFGREMINWHSGERYIARTVNVHPGNSLLSASGKVLSYNYFSDDVGLHEPLTDTLLEWDGGMSISQVAITADERYVIAHGRNGSCRIWPLPALKPVQRCGAGKLFADKLAYIATHPADGSFAVAWDRRVAFYRPDAEDRQHKVFGLSLSKPIVSLAVSADNRLAIGDNSGTLEVWDGVQRKLLGQAKLGPDAAGTKLQFSPSGRQLLYGRNPKFNVHVLDIPQ